MKWNFLLATSLASVIAASVSFSVHAENKVDFTDEKPDAQQLIDALKIKQSSRSKKTRGSSKRGLAVTSQVKETDSQVIPATNSVDLTVQFEFGSSKLTKDAKETLNQLGEALLSSALIKDRFKVIGHTDSVGDNDFNYKLSVERAKQVVYYLAYKFDIASDRLLTEGKGESEPAVSSDPESAKNRRVEVINLGNL